MRVFFCAGEYGEERGRPHFHAVLFGVSFPDGCYRSKSPAGFKVYESLELSDLWKLGHCGFGDVTFESAAYVARYVVKKVTGPGAEDFYGDRKPEFARMSLKPGIGANWLDKFWSDVFPAGQVVSRGHVGNAPRFYRKKFAERFPSAAKAESMAQMESMAARVAENFPERLDAKLKVTKARLSMLKRTI
nr:replication associated protein [Flumine microvirus 20]